MTDPNSLPKPSSPELAAKTAADMAMRAIEPTLLKPGSEPAGAAAKADKAASAKTSHHPVDSVRETIESIAVAFILAFLFRTFVAEAFVIPTGSMATTLMGRHKDVECPNCKYWHQASASAECDEDGNRIAGVNVISTTCPNCGFPSDTRNDVEHPSYKGDRIIVSKMEPNSLNRWDVVVFRFPERAGVNYIKRLVGLPGERIRVLNGDLFAQPVNDSSAPWQILRKPPEVVLAMLREVYDNDYVVPWMTEAGWPPRWQPCPMDIQSLVKAGWSERSPGRWRWPAETTAPGEWVTDDEYRTFRTDGSADKDVWVRYQHFARPTSDAHPEDWDQLILHAPAAIREKYFLLRSTPRQRDELQALKPSGPLSPPAPQKIDDFVGYNYGLAENSPRGSGQPHDRPWVGDLALACQVEAAAAKGGGELVLELVEAGHRFHCRLNLADRSAALTIDEGSVSFRDESGTATAASVTAKEALPSDKSFQVLFANVDSQLLLWIDGDLVKFDGATTYDLPLKQGDRATADYSPLGIGSRGASVKIQHLRVLRDTYYLAQGNIVSGYNHYRPDKEETADTYPLEADRFFVLGDNSPQSADARAWAEPYVERKLMIGKALFIFWPHSWDSPLPFTPNWKRMQFIR